MPWTPPEVPSILLAPEHRECFVRSGATAAAPVLPTLSVKGIYWDLQGSAV